MDIAPYRDLRTIRDFETYLTNLGVRFGSATESRRTGTAGAYRRADDGIQEKQYSKFPSSDELKPNLYMKTYAVTCPYRLITGTRAIAAVASALACRKLDPINARR